VPEDPAAQEQDDRALAVVADVVAVRVADPRREHPGPVRVEEVERDLAVVEQRRRAAHASEAGTSRAVGVCGGSKLLLHHDQRNEPDRRDSVPTTSTAKCVPPTARTLSARLSDHAAHRRGAPPAPA
jgi:hypothetical protein